MSKTLGEKLFELVQESQGVAFISDMEYTDEEAMERAEISLTWSRETVRLLSAFIRRETKKRREALLEKVISEHLNSRAPIETVEAAPIDKDVSE